MRLTGQNLRFRRGATCALPLRFWCAIGFALWFGTWTGPNAWAVTVSPVSMSFQGVQGATNPPSQSITVSKGNKHQTNWTATDSAAWLTVSPGIGTITSTAQVAVGVNTAGLAAGTYTASITITLAKGGSASVPVTLTVAPAITTSSSSTTTVTGTSTTASLAWSPPSTSTGVAGYKVYIGTASGVYGSSINVGNVTSYVANNLAVGNTYYFAVTDYNSSGIESLPSNEVSKSIY